MPSDNDSPALSLIVCFPELLVGQAIAAALEAMAAAHDVVVTTSARAMVSCLGRRFDVALVSDAIGEELHELIRAVGFGQPTLPVLVLSSEVDPDAAARYIEWGAIGTVNPTGSIDVIIDAIRTAMRRELVFMGGQAGEVLRALRRRRAARHDAQSALAGLTPREREIAEALSIGVRPVEIAARMSLSIPTVRASIRSCGDKLGTRGQLRVAEAARHLLVAATPPENHFFMV